MAQLTEGARVAVGVCKVVVRGVEDALDLGRNFFRSEHKADHMRVRPDRGDATSVVDERK